MRKREMIRREMMRRKKRTEMRISRVTRKWRSVRRKKVEKVRMEAQQRREESERN
jgi:hypothetical protein